MSIISRQVGIAGASGTFKGVFVHGVLTAFERVGFTAGAYAGASSSTLSCSAAAAYLSEEVGLDYWYSALDILTETEGNLSQVVLQSIHRYSPMFKQRLFTDEAPRLLISTSYVSTLDAAEQTQGPASQKLGKRLLINALRHNDKWALENLIAWIFDSKSSDTDKRLSADNYDEVAYATTRMLHAWKIPAAINNRPFIDASYTDSCPAAELFRLGYETVIAISPEPEPVYSNIFRVNRLDDDNHQHDLHLITPDEDPIEHGVDFTNATRSGLEYVYQQGIEKGEHFLKRFGY